MEINEKTLRLWERNPVRYKDEIRRLDKQLTDRFISEMRTKTRFYRQKLNLREYLKVVQEEAELSVLQLRITKMTAYIDRMEREELIMSIRMCSRYSMFNNLGIA